MKKLGVISILLIVSTLAFCQSKDFIEPWSERLNRAENWFKKYDINGDGKLSLEEFPENAKKWWDLANYNGDNYVTWDEEKHFQTEEFERAFITKMREVERFCNIQYHLGGNIKLEKNQFQDISGEWLLFATMSDIGNQSNGIMFLIIDQKKKKLKGELRQMATPNNEDIEFSLDINNQFKGKYNAVISGSYIQSSGEKPMLNLIILKRKDIKSNFTALFTGHISANGKTIIAQLINNSGTYGTMFMIRRDFILKLNQKELALLTNINKETIE
jgi:hypothetical protein